MFGLVGAANNLGRESSPRTIYHTLKKDGSVPLKGGNTLKFENNRQASVYAADEDFPVNTFRWVKVIEYREKNGKQGFQSNGDHVIKVLDLNKKLRGRVKATLSSDKSDVSISLQKVTELTGENILYGGSIIWDWTEPDTQLAIISETTLLGKPSFEERMVNFLRGGLGEQEPVLGQAEFSDLSKTHVLANFVTGKSQSTDTGRKYISTLSFDTSKQPRKFTLFSCCEWDTSQSCQACSCFNCHGESVPCTGGHDQTNQRSRSGSCADTLSNPIDCPIEPVCYYPEPRLCEERAPSTNCRYSPDMEQETEECPPDDFESILNDCIFTSSDGTTDACRCFDPISYHIGGGAYVPCCEDEQGQRVACAHPHEEAADDCPSGPDQGGCLDEVCTYSDGSNEHPYMFMCDLLEVDDEGQPVLGDQGETMVVNSPFPCDHCCSGSPDGSTPGTCPPHTQIYTDDQGSFASFTCEAIECSNSHFVAGDRTCRDCCMDDTCDHDTLTIGVDDDAYHCEVAVCEQRPVACVCQEVSCTYEPPMHIANPTCYFDNDMANHFPCSDCCSDNSAGPQDLTCDISQNSLLSSDGDTAWSDCNSLWCTNRNSGMNVLCADCCRDDTCYEHDCPDPVEICTGHDVPCAPFVDAAGKPSAFFSLVVLLSMCAFY